MDFMEGKQSLWINWQPLSFWLSHQRTKPQKFWSADLDLEFSGLQMVSFSKRKLRVSSRRGWVKNMVWSALIYFCSFSFILLLKPLVLKYRGGETMGKSVFPPRFSVVSIAMLQSFAEKSIGTPFQLNSATRKCNEHGMNFQWYEMVE